MNRGPRNKKKYPKSPGDYTRAEIEAAYKKAGTIKVAAVALKVCAPSLCAAMRQRNIGIRKAGGPKSKFDWAAIEKAWRIAGRDRNASVFARERGINVNYFRTAAIARGFYTCSGSEPSVDTAVVARGYGKRIEDMTREEKARASESLNDILHYQRISEFVLEEKRHLASVTNAAATTTPSARQGAM